MKTGIQNSVLISLLTIAVGVAACAESSSGSAEPHSADNTSSDLDNAAQLETEVVAETGLPAKSADLLLRAGSYYRLEWENDDALCASALDALNKPYAPAANSREAADKNGRSYAFRQAERALGTDGNVKWRRSEPISGADRAEIADVDYFNDGTDRRVARLHSQLSGSDIISLGVIDSSAAAPALLSLGHAGANTENLPPQDNLHTKLTYSVADIMRLQDGFFTLVATLEDVDPSGRAYLIQWDKKSGRSAPYNVDDYYPEITCIYAPANAQPTTGE